MSQEPFPDEVQTDERDEVVEETKTTRKKRGLNGVVPATDEAIRAFSAALATGTRELNVIRKSGPKGPTHTHYRGRLIQTGSTKQKLPPEALGSLVASIDTHWGGGVYKVFPDTPRLGETIDNLVIPGRPKPIDAAQQADDDADVEEGAAESGRALPRLDGFDGGFVPGHYAPPTSDSYGIPSPRPGFVYDPVLRQQIPLAPYHDPRAKDVERENEELRRKVELDPLQREVADLRRQADRPPVSLESPFKGIIEMMQLQQQEAQRQREHQLTLEREERKAKEQREEEERKFERDRLTQRAEDERAERGSRDARDREDRIDREKDRKALLDTVLKITLSEGGKRNPVDDLAQLLAIGQGVKDWNAPAPKSEAAEIAEAVGATGKDLIGALGDAFRGRGNGNSEVKQGNPLPQDERLQMVEVLDFLCALAGSDPPLSPRAAFNTVAGYCHGRGIDFNKVCEQIKGYSTLEAVAKLREDLKAKVTLVPSEFRPKIENASAMLEDQGKQQWLLELGTVAVGKGA